MPDIKNIEHIKGYLDKILENEPSDEELDYDEEAIGMYADMHNLKESIENFGLDGIEPDPEPNNCRESWKKRCLTIPYDELDSIFDEETIKERILCDGVIYLDSDLIELLSKHFGVHVESAHLDLAEYETLFIIY